ncbi:hypothetical protein MBANPS3_012241 [Mucor bainieri]
MILPFQTPTAKIPTPTVTAATEAALPAAAVVDLEATDDIPHAEERTAEEIKKRKLQDTKNGNKRKNCLRDDAYEIAINYKSDHETIWQAVLAAKDEFTLKSNKSK